MLTAADMAAAGEALGAAPCSPSGSPAMAYILMMSTALDELRNTSKKEEDVEAHKNLFASHQQAVDAGC